MEENNITKKHISKTRIIFSICAALCVVLLLPLTVGDEDHFGVNEQEIVITPSKVAVENDSNLEFWFKEKVGEKTFQNHQEKIGMVGGSQYYGLKYKPDINESGFCLDPEECVLYTVTSYPDYSDSAQYITHIYISDPDVTVYGLTFNSTHEEIKTRMEEEGYIVTIDETKLSAKKDDVTINFVEDVIYVNVEVTNKEGIIF